MRHFAALFNEVDARSAAPHVTTIVGSVTWRHNR